MSFRSIHTFPLILLCLASVPSAAQDTPTVQSPRQAVLEMFSGGDQAFRKHLTDEVRRQLENAAGGKEMSGNGAGLLSSISMGAVVSKDSLQTFTDGPILFAVYNPEQHERFEVHIEGDDLHGTEDDMELSFHVLKQGVEQDIPIVFRVLLTLKEQEEVWRLNAVTLSVRMPVGDPHFFDNPIWKKIPGSNRADAAPKPAQPEPVPAAEVENLIAPLRAVRLMGLAEDVYVQKHPGHGYTCAVADLVNVGRGFDNGQEYTFMDPQFAGGVYNGYRFSITGCDSRAPQAIEIVAEPVSGKGKAYCSDRTHGMRSSDDGLGATCLVAGRTAF